MSEKWPKSLQKYKRLLSRTLSNKHPSQETIKKHFELVRIVAKNETSLDDLDDLKAFSHESHVHFQNSIRRKGTSREEELNSQYEETLEAISKRFDKLRTTEKERSVTAHAGGIGLGYEQKEKKKLPKGVSYV
jgi:hypothetical protein